MNQNNNIIGYDSQTGQPIYGNQNTNIQQPTQPQMNTGYTQQPTQPQPPKKSKKGLVVVAVLAIIAVIAGIVLFGNQDKKEPTNNETPNNSEVENNNEQNNEQQNNNTGSSSDLIEEEYTGTKQNLTVATVGHVDHGKSTLTSAITKFYGKYKTADEIDGAPEVKKNGITYNASFVEYETTSRHYSHYDMPGHADYVKTIISGSVKLDGAILVVAATDGPMAQTREHLKLLHQAGVEKIVVYMSKCDMVDDNELLSLVEMEIRELVSEYGFDGDNTPIIKGSALKAIEGDKDGEASIRELITSMDKWLSKKENHEISYPHTKINAAVYVLSKEEGGRHTPFFNDYKPQISSSTARENGTITLPAGVEMVMPGDNVDMTITLEKAMSFKKGDNFQILEDGKLVAVGVIESIEQ